MEKFEVYNFDGVFYSKEEIKKMGLFHLSFSKLKGNLVGKNPKTYEITTYSSMTEITCSLEDYFKSFDPDKEVFFQDCVDHGICIAFDEFYGIRYNENHAVLFCSIFERDRAYQNLEKNILNQLDEIMHQNQLVEYNSQQFIQQEEVKQKQKKLLEIIDNK